MNKISSLSYIICSLSLAVVSLTFLASCAESQRSQGSISNVVAKEIQASDALVKPEYAQGFSVKYAENGVRLVDLRDPQDENSLEYHFALVPRDMENVKVPEGYEVVEVPVRSAVFMTSLQLSNVIALEAYDVVSGINSSNNLFNAVLNERIKSGKTIRIGKEGNFDAEKIIATQPDVVFISPFKRGGYDAIREVGVRLVPHLGYKEVTPLGQAEWVKFVSMFTGDEVKANRLFAGIATRYNAVKDEVARKVKHRPSVLSGEMHGGSWYAVGGKSFLAQIFKDAGAEYVLSDNNDTGGVYVDFEKLYAKAAEADYWRILNSYQGTFTYDALKASEQRNEEFKAFKNKGVIYCNMTQTPYYESAIMNPDLLLRDFVAVFHPELSEKDYEPRYYKLLK